MPGFQRGDSNSGVDVNIQYGEVVEHIDGTTAEATCFQASPEQVLILLPSIARILVVNGKSVTIKPLTQHKEKVIQLFLINHVLGIILHQQEKLVLHASVIQKNQKVIAFAGETGSGKSTLCAALCEQTDSFLIADEHCVLLNHCSLGLQVLSGSPLVQVWEDALTFIGKKTNNLDPIRPDMQKYYLPVRQPVFLGKIGPPLMECYLLKWGSDSQISIRELCGQEKLTALLQQVYLWHYVKGMALQHQVFLKCSKLATQIAVFEFQRPRSFHRLEATIHFLDAAINRTTNYDSRIALDNEYA